MVKLPVEILVQVENIEFIIGQLDDALSRTKRTNIELAGISGYLMMFYNCLENILKQTVKINKIEFSFSGLWNKELLKTAKKSKIISHNMKEILLKYLVFRDEFIFGYIYFDKDEKVVLLGKDIKKVWETFNMEIKDFYKERDLT